jgi:hypothetical protein
MLRILLTFIVPLLLPTAIYLLWIRLASGPLQAEAPGRQALPWIWLAGAGVLLLALVLFFVSIHYGSPQQGGVYVPPRWEQGHIVPPHIDPKPAE